MPFIDGANICDQRFIPAYTGNAKRQTLLWVSPTVYPRVYGECGLTGALPRLHRGLSPRIRGMLTNYIPAITSHRFIPAYTGNAFTKCSARYLCPVYPRVYGECATNGFLSRAMIGLSPRIRGMRAGFVGCSGAVRFIPAYTGNAILVTSLASMSPVYPRVYGECALARPLLH